VIDRYLGGKPLEELYDSVLIPALAMAEQDRHQNNLDEATERFIFQSARELVEDAGEAAAERVPEPAQAPGAEQPHAVTAPGERNGESAHAFTINAGAANQGAASQGTVNASAAIPGATTSGVENSRAENRMSTGQPAALPIAKVVCVPASDDSDEIAAMMLCQLLERAGYAAQSVAMASTSEMMAQVAEEKPGVLCISAMPPFVLSHARSLYRKLRGQWPELPIVIGLWTYTGDPGRIGSRIVGVHKRTGLAKRIDVHNDVGVRNDVGVHDEVAQEKDSVVATLAQALSRIKLLTGVVTEVSTGSREQPNSNAVAVIDMRATAAEKTASSAD